MHVLAEFGAQDAPLSEFARKYNPYFLSGEINSTVNDVPAAKSRIQAAFADRADFDQLDGITVVGRTSDSTDAAGSAGDSWWWFNVRASNTEPLLRLNVEARDQAVMAAVRDEVLALIRQA
jgi:phosphomannomutase